MRPDARHDASPHRSPDRLLQRESGFTIPEVAALTAAAILSLVAWSASPALGVLLTVFSLPVAVRGALVARRRARLGLSTSPGKRVRMLIGSVLSWVTIVSLVSLAVLFSLVAAMGFACTTVVVTRGQGSESLIAATMVGGPLVSLAAGVWLGGRWIRHRWRRDTEEQEVDA